MISEKVKKKQKILFVLHLPPPVHGASMVGKYIRDSRLINSEFDCHYVNLTTAASLEDIGKGGVRKLWAFCRKLKEIYLAIRRTRPDVVYVTPNTAKGPFYKDFVIVEWCKWWSGKRTILHFHNKGVATRQDRWLDNRLYRRFFRHTEVILLGEPLYEDVRKYVAREHVHFCANGIEEATKRWGYETERSSYETLTLRNAGATKREGGARILFLSNLLIEKGVLELLDALVILKERGREFVCDFVGGETAEMDAAKFQQEVATRGLERLAVYHGKRYGEEKEAFFQRADIFCFPTFYHNECFPLVLLEAMQHGLPCISTNEGAISCIIDDGVTGLVVERHHTEQLAEKLEWLLTHPQDCDRMGAAGRVKFEREFTLERFEQRFTEVLREGEAS